MRILITCPYCQESEKAPEQWAGTELRCQCGTIFQAPELLWCEWITDDPAQKSGGCGSGGCGSGGCGSGGCGSGGCSTGSGCGSCSKLSTCGKVKVKAAARRDAARAKRAGASLVGV